MRSFDESKYHLGSLCKRGHNHENTGKSLRYSNGGTCIQCVMLWHEKNRGYQDGYYRKNREKLTIKKKEYRQKHPEACLARQREYVKNNYERIRARRKEYQAKNHEKLYAVGKLWRLNNPEKVAAIAKKSQRKCRDKINAWGRKHHSENRESDNRKEREYRATHRERVNKYQMEYYRQHHEKIRIQAKKLADKYCKELGENYVKNQIQHQSGLLFEDMTPELVELKRIQLRANRASRAYKKGRAICQTC